MFDRQERTQHNEERRVRIQQHRHCRGLSGHRGPNGAHPHGLPLDAQEHGKRAASGRGRRCQHNHNTDGNSLDAPECRKGATLAEERHS